jgi:hypothetical protein
VVNDNQQAREVTAEFRKKLTGMGKLNPEADALDKRTADAVPQEEQAKGK